MNNLPARRVVLLGLDGATFSILDPLIQAGHMPFLKGFMDEGVRGILHSTPHPLTPPAWTTVMTGRSPGNHGVFDFVRVDVSQGKPNYTLVTSADIQCESVWSIASRQNRRVTALNFPCMFPPPDINGFVVPGYVPWHYISRAVHPRDLYQRLKSQSAISARELGTDWELERKAIQGLPEDELEGWVKFHIAREHHWAQIAKYLMQEEPCELTAVVFDGVDRLQHLCYHLIDPELAQNYTSESEKSVRRLCLNYFHQLDDELAEIASLAGPEAQIFMVSDHGFAPSGENIFYANTWLERHGYLSWAEGIPVDKESRLALETHDESTALFDWSNTTAFALTSSSNAIYIKQSLEPGDPGVLPEDYPAFRDRLVQSLLEYVDPKIGQKVVRKVLTRADDFSGTCSDRAPDLTLVLQDYSFLSVLRSDDVLQPRLQPYGVHHPDGIFLGRGPGIRAGVELDPFSILNVAPTMLYGLGLSIPDDLEGVPAIEAFEADYLQDRPVRVDAPTENPSIESASLPAEEELEVLERLKALGYLE